MNRDLKPCPFCGDYPELYSKFTKDNKYKFAIICGCGCRLGEFTHDQLAIDAWNRRAEDE